MNFLRTDSINMKSVQLHFGQAQPKVLTCLTPNQKYKTVCIVDRWSADGKLSASSNGHFQSKACKSKSRGWSPISKT